MFVEHLVYSTAVAIVFGMLYSRFFGRDLGWVIVLSAFAPDFDIHPRVGVFLINHGDFHNILYLGVYATMISFFLYFFGFRFRDSFVFAGVGYGAHILEDLAVSHGPAYKVLWPFSDQGFYLDFFSYDRFELYGVADQEVLIFGLLLVALAAAVRTFVEGMGWITSLMGLLTKVQQL
jgi:membrane-bound metal-dependent hydrolase YbcI (DUF457 family)